ncbi:MAG TPA: hypothetical protein VJS30_20885 [Paraburkholderia sp.]|nr:hypothetical protein [Paraburkholderia sp.]
MTCQFEVVPAIAQPVSAGTLINGLAQSQETHGRSDISIRDFVDNRELDADEVLEPGEAYYVDIGEVQAVLWVWKNDGVDDEEDLLAGLKNYNHSMAVADLASAWRRAGWSIGLNVSYPQSGAPAFVDLCKILLELTSGALIVSSLSQFPLARGVYDARGL